MDGRSPERLSLPTAEQAARVRREPSTPLSRIFTPSPQEPPRASQEPPRALRAGGSSEADDGAWVERDGSRENDGSWEEDRTRARATALGIGAELGRPFRCVLPGHDDVATLYPTP